MNITLHAWDSLRKTWPIRKSEWTLAAATVGIWALFALRPELFDSSQGYAGMASTAQQWVWQWFCCVLGFGRLAALFVNGAYWRTPLFRSAFAFLSCLMWYQIVADLAQNAGLGMVLGMIPLVLDFFNFKQAAMEAAVSEGLRGGEHHAKRVRADA